MKDVIGDIDRPLERPTSYLVPHPATWKNYTCCPWAKTVIVIDHETDRPVICPVTCKRWGCPYCAVRKIRKLAFLVNGAAPNRWVRLGVNPRNYDSPKDAWEQTSALVPEHARRLKKILGKEVEYLRVTELHKSGFPHYHALLRSPFIPVAIFNREWASLTQLKWPGREHLRAAVNDCTARGYRTEKLEALLKLDDPPEQKLKDAWRDATGCPYNWIAKIDATFSSFRYMVKYLTKLHRLEWTARHVSYSRNFFREEDREKLAFPERDIIEKSDEHPWVYLSRRYDRESVGVDANGCYHVDELYCGTPNMYGRTDCGLPYKSEPDAPPPPKQVQRTMVDTSPKEDYESASF